MIKALWFMIKIGLLVALIIWVAERPGFVRLEWMEYAFTVHIGLFLLGFVAVILLSIFVYNVIRTFVDFPKSFRRYQEIKNREKGYKALTLGLTAVAAGDTKVAVNQARRASKLLAGDNGLPALLEAQAARLEGREDDAVNSFLNLLENKDAAFLGVRGLLQAALDGGHYAKALELAQHALKLHPRQKWILRVAYDLEIRQRQWDKARKTLRLAEKAGAVLPDKALSDRIVMLLAEADEDLQKGVSHEALVKIRKAVRLDPSFVPANIRLAKLYNQMGRRKKAVSAIEKAWKINPHPGFTSLWESLAKTGKSKEPLVRLRWFEELLKINSKTAAGLMAAGRIALEESLWGEARHFFKQAEEIEPSAELYRLWAELEERSSQNGPAAKSWLEKADAVGPSNVWVCRETGRIYEEWLPIAQPHGSFNTIEWGLPTYSENVTAGLSGPQDNMTDSLIEVPRIKA